MGPVSVGLTALSSILGGVEQNDALRRGAAADDENARRATLQGELDAQHVRRDALLAVGAGLASSASDGVPISGSVQDLIEQSALERERDIINLRIQAADENTALRQAAEDKRAAGKSALIAGFIGAAASVAGGAADMKNQGKLDAANARRRTSEMGPQAIVTGDQPMPSRTGGATHDWRNRQGGWSVPRRRFGTRF